MADAHQINAGRAVDAGRMVDAGRGGDPRRGPPAWRPVPSGDEDQEQADRQTASLAGLAVALFLVVAGLFVLHQLAAKAAVEDCLLANFSNCDVLTAGLR